MEIFDNISKELREASLSLGATQWQTIKYVVLRKARPGMIAADNMGSLTIKVTQIFLLTKYFNVPQISQIFTDLETCSVFEEVKNL